MYRLIAGLFGSVIPITLSIFALSIFALSLFALSLKKSLSVKSDREQIAL